MIKYIVLFIFIPQLLTAQVSLLFKKKQQPLIVMSGESNSGGQALIADAPSYLTATYTGLQIWNNSSNLFEAIDYGVNNLIGHANMSTPTLRMSWEVAIGDYVRKNILKNPTYLVKTGQGGTKIADWAVGATYLGISPWTVFQNRVDSALNELQPSGTKFVMLFSIGINDGINGTVTATWKAAVKAHFEKIRAKYGTVPIVMTKIMSSAGTYYTAYNTAIEEICTEMSNVYFVETEDATRDDIYHWDADGQKLIGERMLNKLIENGHL